jgi:alpha-N-arabinofuranosidase
MPIAITEYAPIFSLGKGATDALIASPAGAIFLADVLRVFAQAPSVLLATHWSLSANWLFGAIHAGGFMRPAGRVLQLMGEALRGERIDARVQTPAVRVASIGQVGALDGMPLIETLVTRERRALRIVVINKDPQRAATGRIDLGRVGWPAQARISLLSARDLFDSSDARDVLSRTDSTIDIDEKAVALRLPPHSVALVTIDLAIA